MSEREWVTLLEVNDRLEAAIIKEALEAQGIPAVFFQEGAAQFGYPVGVGPLSMVEICVPSDRLTEAQAWLDAYENGELENQESENAEVNDAKHSHPDNE